jgi:hypothetical protein
LKLLLRVAESVHSALMRNLALAITLIAIALTVAGCFKSFGIPKF